MTTNNNNGMGNKVAAANIVKIFDNFVISDGNISANYFGHDKETYMSIEGAEPIDSAQGLIDFAGSVYGQLNCGDIIIGGKTYYFSITTNTGVETPDGWVKGVRLSVYDGEDRIAEYTTTIGRVWSKKTMAWAMETLYGFMSNLDYEQKQQDWADFVDMCDRKDEIVSAYQTEIDGYVQDIIAIRDKMENIKSKMEAFAIKEIIGKIMQTEQDCYTAIMDADCVCFGIEIDLMGLWLWYNNYGQHYTDNNFSREDLDLEDLIDALDYMITESDMPLGCDNPFEDEDWRETLEECYDGNVEHFFQIFEEEFGYCLEDYPYYLWDSLAEFARTYVHYAYCA